MKKNIFILIFSLVIGLFICNYLAGIYFNYRYGVSYFRKAIATKKINRLPANKLKKFLAEDQEFFLTKRKYNPVVTFDLALEEFKLISAGSKVGDRRSSVVLEAPFVFDEETRKKINDREYSLAFAAVFQGDGPEELRLAIALENKVAAVSAPALYKDDLLIAVLPAKENPLPLKEISLRISSRNKGALRLKQPRLILTPLVAPSPVRNYVEPVNFQKQDKVRIIATGGSTTYGVGSAYNATWPNMLQQRLNYFYPDKFEVMNLALWGACAMDIRQCLDKLLIIRYGADKYLTDPKGIKRVPRYHFGYNDLKPDFLLIAPCWNDIPYYLIYAKDYDRPFFFGKSFRQVDRYLQDKLCTFALGFFVYHALDKAMLVYLSAGTRQDRVFRAKLAKLYQAGELEEIAGFDSGNLGLLSKNYELTLKEIAKNTNRVNTQLHFVSLPGIVFTRTTKELEKSRQRLGWNKELFLMNLWAYSSGGRQERLAMKQAAGEAACGFSDILERFKDFDYKQKQEIFNDFIHLTDEGNNFVSAIIFHDLEGAFSRKARN